MSKRSTKIKAEELQSSSDTSSRQRQSKKDEVNLPFVYLEQKIND
jgi:hypothetical protein